VCGLCQPPYKPDSLTKLSNDERIEYVYNSIFPTNRTVYKDTIGNVIDKMDFTDPTLFQDFYVNDDGDIIECIVRKITNADRVFWKKIIDAAQERDSGKLKIIDIECEDQKIILESLVDVDQQNRNGNMPIDESIDRNNLSVLLSIIEKCGFPRKEEVGKKGMNSVFLILQHGDRKNAEKYLPMLKRSAENGDISWQQVALLEDRTLMFSGQKQKYGSQVKLNSKTGKYELYSLDDPINVNERRRSVGLDSIHLYLQKWNILFEY
jgi:hypothetical protein